MILELENIYKHFYLNNSEEKLQILDNLNLSVEKGDTIAITGPSGSGKSTLLNIIGTLDVPSSGSVKLNGSELTKLNNNQLSDIRNENIGFVFQLHHLLPQLNLLDNVLLPTLNCTDKSKKKLSNERARFLLNEVGLSERTNQYPGELSGGECQRAAVVRALINEPEILLADEPTGSLDYSNSEQISELLLHLNKTQNVTLITVTHSQDIANQMNKKYLLNQGNLILQ